MEPESLLGDIRCANVGIPDIAFGRYIAIMGLPYLDASQEHIKHSCVVGAAANLMDTSLRALATKS